MNFTTSRWSVKLIVLIVHLAPLGSTWQSGSNKMPDGLSKLQSLEPGDQSVNERFPTNRSTDVNRARCDLYVFDGALAPFFNGKIASYAF